ncbi:MAG: hypothetical protein JXR70_04505 [Spirochaetales bacterium]|nr:hypothetical protein [Spirochaetales bacterium]
MKNEFIKAYTIGDFFEKTLKLLKLGWKKSLLLGGILLLPVAIIQGIGAIASAESVLLMLENLPELFSGGSDSFSDFVKSFSQASLSSGGINWVQTLFLLLVLLVLRSAITLYAFKLIGGKNPGIGQISGEVLRSKLLRLIGQGFLQLLVLLGAGLIFGIAGGIGAVILRVVNINTVFVVFISIVFIIAVVGVSIWLSFIFFMAPLAILHEDITPSQSMKKSVKLMQNNWWRIFLISLVASLGLSFAITIATTPLSTIAYLPYYEGIFKLYSGMMEGGESSVLISEVVEKLKNMSLLIIIISYISILAEYLVWPFFQALLYIDVKFRNNDFPSVPFEGDMNYNSMSGNSYSAALSGDSSVQDVTIDDNNASGDEAYKPKDQDE